VLGALYRSLMINNNVGATLNGAVSAPTLTIGNYTTSSLFHDGGYLISSTGTLNLTSGTFKLGSSATATAWPAFNTRNISPGTTVEYASEANQTVSITPAYSNLIFSGSGVKTPAAGTLGVSSTWSTNSPTALNTNNTLVSTSGNLNGTGNITQGSGNISLEGDWLNVGTFTAGSASVILTGASHIISGPATGISFKDLKVNGTYTNNTPGTITVTSALSGTGVLTQGTNTTLDIKGNGTIAGLSANTNVNSVTFTGGNQSITGNYNYYNVSFTGTAARTVTFTGNSITTVASGGSLTFEGVADNVLTLASSDVNDWHLHVDPAASVAVSYVSVTNSDASGYQEIDASNGTNEDGGGGGTNLNWVFEAPAAPENFLNVDGVDLEGFSFQ
jgi:hypothetical protein